jgi:hypothetical protein
MPMFLWVVRVLVICIGALVSEVLRVSVFWRSVVMTNTISLSICYSLSTLFCGLAFLCAVPMYELL